MICERNINPNQIFLGWSVSDTTNVPGFAMALGHVETFDPESAIRNFSDICEAMEIHPEKFCYDDGTTVPGLCIEMDNGHGTREKATQFCAMLLLYLKNLDFVWISCNARGWSKLVPAEKVKWCNFTKNK